MTDSRNAFTGRIRAMLPSVETPHGGIVMKFLLVAWIAVVMAPGFAAFMISISYWRPADDLIFERTWLGSAVFGVAGLALVGWFTAACLPMTRSGKILVGGLVGLFGAFSAITVWLGILITINGACVVPEPRHVESTVTRVLFLGVPGKSDNASLRYAHWNDRDREERTACPIGIAGKVIPGKSHVSAVVYRGRLGFDILEPGTLRVDGVMLR